MSPADIAAKDQKIDRLLQKVVDQKRVFGATLSVRTADGSYSFTGGAGNLTPDALFFIASTTKLYLTTLVMQFRAEGKLQLEDPVVSFVEPDVIQNLHVLKGKDHSGNITIRHLLAHTSGLPDYFQQNAPGRRSLEKELLDGHDQAWTFTEMLTRARAIRPAFVPGAKNKALYSDTNFQLLGHIVERVGGKTLSDLLHERIFSRLNLVRTYLYADPKDVRPALIYYKKQPLVIPRAMASFGPDGGLVSTCTELMRFLMAFFDGELFPRVFVPELQQWNPAFFPLDAGIGVMRCKLPRLFSPFRPLPSFVGHSGLSGAFAFFCPEKNLYLAGTVNQIADPSTSFRLMFQIAMLF